MTDSNKQTTQTNKQIAQAGNQPAEAGNKPTQVGNQNAQSEQNEAKNLLLMTLLSKVLLNRRRRRWVRENRKGFSVDCLTTYRWRRSLLVR